jgi:signal transduction histidine kinase/CheY-like chemotaxis protein
MLNRIRHRSIARKLTLVNMLVTAVALILACSAFSAYDLYRFRAAIVGSLSTISQIMGSNIAAALLFNDQPAAGHTLSALTASPHVLQAQIYTSQRKLFASYGRDSQAQGLLLPSIPFSRKQTHRFAQKQLALVNPILFGGKLIGFVFIRSDLLSIDDRLRSYALIAAAVMLVSLIAAWLISRMSQRFISTPVVRLAETARTIYRQKDYSIRFPATAGHDELATLGQAFNEMLAEIQQRDTALLCAHNELEQRVQQRTTQLATANFAKSKFLSNMSHEIRTPLNAILGYAQLMSRDPGIGANAQANLKIIGRSGAHLLNLINAVLDMSRIEAGRTEITPVTFNLSSLLEDLAAMFRLRAEAKALRFEMLVDGEEVAYVKADEGKIRQALINLLANAIKFSERGHVRLHAHLKPKDASSFWLCCDVEDTGLGITPQDQERLFKPFTQAKGRLNTQEGTGLGLAISREFARLMGGDVTLTSSPGRGSTFRFEIPVERGEAGVALQRVGPRHVKGIVARADVPRILIVDDQLENRDWLLKLLTAIGFSVRSANDGEAAFREWEAWKPGVILMDIHMPVMDGIEATRRIRAHPQGDETFIVALTASVMEEDRRVVFGSGADAFLTKPCPEDELLEKIRVPLKIDYRYEEDVAASDLSALNAGTIAFLPAALAEELRNAITDGNMKLLHQLILRVRETAAAGSADALEELAGRYDYDGLTRLLEAPCRP